MKPEPAMLLAAMLLGLLTESRGWDGSGSWPHGAQIRRIVPLRGGSDLPGSIAVHGSAGAAQEALRQGEACMQAFDFEGAVDAFTRGIATDPDNKQLYTARSKAYSKLDRISDALKDAMKVWVGGSGTGAGAPAPHAQGAAPLHTVAGAGAASSSPFDGRGLKRDPRIYGEGAAPPPAGEAAEDGGAQQAAWEAEKKELQHTLEQALEAATTSKENFSKEKNAMQLENEALKASLERLGLCADGQTAAAGPSAGEKVARALQLWKDVYHRYPFMAKDSSATALAGCLTEIEDLSGGPSMHTMSALLENLRRSQEEAGTLRQQLQDQTAGQGEASSMMPMLEDEVRSRDEQIATLKQALKTATRDHVSRGEALQASQAALQLSQDQMLEQTKELEAMRRTCQDLEAICLATTDASAAHKDERLAQALADLEARKDAEVQALQLERQALEQQSQSELAALHDALRVSREALEAARSDLQQRQEAEERGVQADATTQSHELEVNLKAAFAEIAALEDAQSDLQAELHASRTQVARLEEANAQLKARQAPGEDSVGDLVQAAAAHAGRQADVSALLQENALLKAKLVALSDTDCHKGLVGSAVQDRPAAADRGEAADVGGARASPLERAIERASSSVDLLNRLSESAHQAKTFTHDFDM